jgi:hypothetical protein
MTEDAHKHAIDNAKGWLASIHEMVARFNAAGEAEDHDTESEVREEMEQGALSVQVRSGWHNPGSPDASEPEEYELLLSTGGPALRIVGDLANCYPTSARLQWQDWFTPWTDHETTDDDDKALLTFAGCYWFGERLSSPAILRVCEGYRASPFCARRRAASAGPALPCPDPLAALWRPSLPPLWGRPCPPLPMGGPAICARIFLLR